jgi:hypothetical protein
MSTPAATDLLGSVASRAAGTCPAALTGHNVGASPSTPGHQAGRTAPSARHCRGKLATYIAEVSRRRDDHPALAQRATCSFIAFPPTVDPYPKGVRRAVTPNEQRGGVPWVTRRANNRPRTAQLAS